MEKPNEFARAQGLMAQARAAIHQALGLIEVAMVLGEDEWTVEQRNVYARLILTQECGKRKHPNDHSRVSPLVKLAASYADEPTAEKLAELEAWIGSQKLVKP